MVYLDNAATTPVREEVLEVIHQALKDNYGNPSSTYEIGKSAKRLLNNARKQLAELLNVPESNVYFTSGATEANNWAIRSQAYTARDKGKGNHLVATAVEHSSVKKMLQYLETEGFSVTYITPDAEGRITTEAFIDATTSQTIGWIAMAVNNEVGSVLPVFQLGEKAQELDLWFHVDAVQAIGHLDWNYADLNCTSFAASGHKFNAPKGIGFLVYRPYDKEMILEPLIYGGGQEFGKRPGTENMPYIVGMVKALEIALAVLPEMIEHYKELQSYLFAELRRNNIPFEINGDLNHHAPHINNIWLKGILASQMIIKADLAGVALSGGSACSAGSITVSPVLEAYYPDETDRLQESIRISFGYQTTQRDLDEFIEVLVNN